MSEAPVTVEAMESSPSPLALHRRTMLGTTLNQLVGFQLVIAGVPLVVALFAGVVDSGGKTDVISIYGRTLASTLKGFAQVLGLPVMQDSGLLLPLLVGVSLAIYVPDFLFRGSLGRRGRTTMAVAEVTVVRGLRIVGLAVSVIALIVFELSLLTVAEGLTAAGHLFASAIGCGFAGFFGACVGVFTPQQLRTLVMINRVAAESAVDTQTRSETAARERPIVLDAAMVSLWFFLPFILFIASVVSVKFTGDDAATRGIHVKAMADAGSGAFTAATFSALASLWFRIGRKAGPVRRGEIRKLVAVGAGVAALYVLPPLLSAAVSWSPAAAGATILSALCSAAWFLRLPVALSPLRAALALIHRSSTARLGRLNDEFQQLGNYPAALREPARRAAPRTRISPHIRRSAKM